VHVVATAGHVDHGKSSLVRALTGIDPDRWAEEKERGLTIDLGFAWAELPSGRGVSFVDVPGHVRFIRNMLAGVGGVDACVFVVAATEGWKPQSEEHLRILEMVDLRHGLVALTKVDAAESDLTELAALEIAEHVEGTFLEDAPIVPVDSLSGRGLDDLRAALEAVLAATPPAADHGRPRLWVDRVFAAKGSGTVVTGTLTGGSLATGDEVVVAPGDRRARIRAIQSRMLEEASIVPGNRVALNLSGIDHHDVIRGDVVVRPGQWHHTKVIDAELTVLGGVEHEVTRRGSHALHVGSAEIPVRLRVLGGSPIAPGSSGLVRLHLPRPIPALPGDRFVVRETGRIETLGGGAFLDIAPVLPASKAAPDRSVDRVVAERGWIGPEELERLTGERRPATIGAWVADPAAVQATEAEVRAMVAAAGQLGLDVALLSDRQRAVLERLGDIEVGGGRARPASVADPLADHPYLVALRAEPFAPPDPTGVPAQELRTMVQRGLAVQVDGVVFAAEAVEAAARLVAGLLADRPEGFTVSEARGLFDTSRKYALPLLGHLDATGVTRRRGDVRIAGPRLPGRT
jgi:selenocysteine-specific elongation factor